MKLTTKILAILVAATSLFACNKYPVPEPNFTEYELSDFEGYTRIKIADLKAMHAIENPSITPTEITEKLLVSGVIVGDDNSGNIYKTLYLQDESGGINLAIDQVNLYNLMPVGQKVFITLDGLYVGDYRACHQIGFKQEDGTMGRWDWVYENYKDENGNYPFRHFYPSGMPSIDNLPAAKVVTSAGDLTEADYNTLVRLENVTFGENGGVLSWSNKEVSENRDAMFSDSTKLVIRTSGYSNFYADTIPTGVGNIVGILSVFATTKQLYIRNRDDIQFENK